jgi:methyltransferase
MVSRGAYLALLGLLAAERVRELRRSRANERRLRARGAVEHGGGHYPAMVALHALLFPACAVERLWRRRGARPAISLAALVGLLGAHALRRSAVRALGDRWTTRVLVLPGVPLVHHGPYRHLRHPNYLAVAVEVACIPLVGGCWLAAATFSLADALLLAVRIGVEERALGDNRVA